MTLDIDALDPSIAPGTGTPQPGGFNYYEAKTILQRGRPRGKLVAAWMSSKWRLHYDAPGQLTPMHAVRLALDTLGAGLESEGSF